jgi:hypothetical protein
VKKLRLDDIQVDSYETHAVPRAYGTVQANMATALCATSPIRCQPTNNASCQSSAYCC